MNDLIKDIRFGLRMLARQPIVTTICLLTLGLGIGASTAIFSVVDATLLTPLPFPEPDRLVAVSASKPAAGWPFMTISYPNFKDWSEQSSSFEATGIYGVDAVNVRGEEHPDRFTAIRASAGRCGRTKICSPAAGCCSLGTDSNPPASAGNAATSATAAGGYAATPRLSRCSAAPRLPRRSATPGLPRRSAAPGLPRGSAAPGLPRRSTTTWLLCAKLWQQGLA